MEDGCKEVVLLMYSTQELDEIIDKEMMRFDEAMET